MENGELIIENSFSIFHSQFSIKKRGSGPFFLYRKDGM